MIQRDSLEDLHDTMPGVQSDELHEPRRRRAARQYQHAPLPQLPAGDPGGTVPGRLALEQNGQHQPPIEPRPDEIARFRFPRKLFGAHPGEVQRVLLEIAATLDRTHAALAREVLERRTLEKSLEAASTTVQDLQQQLLAAKAELTACQDRERALTREFLDAKAEPSRSRPTADGQADELVRVAGQTANAILATARASALDVLRSARAAAQAITQSVDVVIVIDGQAQRKRGLLNLRGAAGDISAQGTRGGEIPAP